MRIRHKPHARAELSAWPCFVADPDSHRGKWASAFGCPQQPLHVELGCGKGGFISEKAVLLPEINFAGFDIKNEMLLVAKHTIEAKFEKIGKNPDNVRISTKNIEFIRDVFSPEDHVERIYINFCNPWYKSGHAKHRLTHPRQLVQYRMFLPVGGQIWFKTDDMPLFKDSLRYFAMAGFAVDRQTEDLHNTYGFENIPTEHEAMFSEMGIPIKACIATVLPATIDFSSLSHLKTI